MRGRKTRASNSSFSTSPGCGAGPARGRVRVIAMSISFSKIIHDLHVPGVAIPELEGDPPRPASRDRPLTSTGAPEAVKADRGQASQIFEAFGLIKQPQPPLGQILVEIRKSPPPLLGKTLGGSIGP